MQKILKKKNHKFYILSYPRSGSHIARYLIELYTGHHTGDDFYNFYSLRKQKHKKKSAIFRIEKRFYQHSRFIGAKRHHFDRDRYLFKNYKLILIIRNPAENILSHIFTNDIDDSHLRNNFENILKSPIDDFIKNINSFIEWRGEKHILSYKKLIKQDHDEISKLYEFIEINSGLSKEKILNNLSKIYKDSLDSYEELTRKSKSQKVKSFIKDNNNIVRHIENRICGEINLYNDLFHDK